MNKTIKTREEEVINILKSSMKVENIINNTYKKSYHKVKRHPSAILDQMPILVSFLYDLIIREGILPSIESFRNAYMDAYYKDIQHDQLLYFAFVDRVNKAYESLIRDLHFYFKLSESGLFDDVQLSYAYDIEAKQDIVVTLGEKKLGLQLFGGNDSHIPGKKRKAKWRRIKLGYPDFYLPLFGSKTLPETIGSEGNPFYVYSFQDVQLIYGELNSQLVKEVEWEEEAYIFPAEKRKEHVKSIPEDLSIQNLVEQTAHSFIYVGPKDPAENLNLILHLTKKGVRIEWITSKKLNTNLIKRKNLRIHYWDGATNFSLMISDGIYSIQEKQLLLKIGKNTSFNFEQYATEHASIDKHLIVEAGAGSGKTETLISRIIYLVQTKNVCHLEEVVMITFTNEAADQLKSKLSKKLFSFFEQTGDLKYLEWNEQVTSMRILTIPSFSRGLIQDFSPEIGMGRNFAVRNLTVERLEVISSILDTYIRDNGLNYHDLGRIKEYELVKTIDRFWTQLEQKGIVLKDFDKIQWGDLPKTKIERTYYELFKSVLSKCEETFTAEKLKKDVFTVNDLTQKIPSIQPFLEEKQLKAPFRFLFVDEFQDTDDTQIELVYKLADVTGAQLFVVGDIKQSIYRFRGANYTAFDLLAEKLGKTKVNREYKLKKNYRTSGEILTALEDLFDCWRNHPGKILPNASGSIEDDNRLKPTVSLRKYDSSFQAVTQFASISEEIYKLYRTLVQDEEDKNDNKPVELAILVRTNYQANCIRKELEILRVKDSSLIYEVITGGTLFSSAAARDLMVLLNALCYDDAPDSIFAIHQTAFSAKGFQPSSLVHLNGCKEKLAEHVSLSEIEGLSEARKGLQIKPTLHVIYKFLTMNPYEEILKALNNQPHEIQKYRLNLYRILELASDSINSSILSIHSLRDWLARQVATNRKEDEMEVDIPNYEKIIKVMTIHKAKGLEFDTVFIPYTTQAIRKKPSQEMIVIKEYNVVHAGWKTKIRGVQSTNYEKLKDAEDSESLREEARLLYVALTRAKNQLLVLCSKPKYPSNKLYHWSDLMRLGKDWGRWQEE